MKDGAIRGGPFGFGWSLGKTNEVAALRIHVPFIDDWRWRIAVEQRERIEELFAHLPVQFLVRFHCNAVKAISDEIFPADPLPAVFAFELDLSAGKRPERDRGLTHNLGVVGLLGVGLEIVEKFFDATGIAQVLTGHAKASPVDVGVSRLFD
jgi:hypothetical protein